MELVKGSVGFATFRAGMGLYAAKIKAVHNIPPKHRLIDLEFEDKTIEWGALPSQFFPSVSAAKKANRAYEKAHTEKNTCSLCRIADGADVLECDSCGELVHEACYAVLNDPLDESDWLCQRCVGRPSKKQIAAFACLLCPHKGLGCGPFVRVSAALDAALPPLAPRWAHWLCASVLGVAITTPKGGSACGGGSVASLAGLRDSFTWLCDVCGEGGGACTRCPVRAQPMSSESPRRFVPLDIGRNVSGVVARLERRGRAKHGEDWEIPARDLLDKADAIADVAAACEEVLSGSDCGAAFHVSCGVKLGLHRALVGCGGPRLDQPYVLCERHSRAIALPVYSRADVPVPEAVAEFLRSGGGGGGAARVLPRVDGPSPSLEWFDRLYPEEGGRGGAGCGAEGAGGAVPGAVSSGGGGSVTEAGPTVAPGATPAPSAAVPAPATVASAAAAAAVTPAASASIDAAGAASATPRPTVCASPLPPPPQPSPARRKSPIAALAALFPAVAAGAAAAPASPASLAPAGSTTSAVSGQGPAGGAAEAGAGASPTATGKRRRAPEDDGGDGAAAAAFRVPSPAPPAAAVLLPAPPFLVLPPPPPPPKLLAEEVAGEILGALPAELGADAEVAELEPALTAAVLAVQDLWDEGWSVLDTAPPAAPTAKPTATVLAQAVAASIASAETRALLCLGTLSAAALVDVAARAVEEAHAQWLRVGARGNG